VSAAIEFSAVRKEYRSFRQAPVVALKALFLEVPVGEVVGLLGPNGAGKSTALWIAMGMLKPSAGFARIMDRPAGDPATYRRIGFLPENFGFHRYSTPANLLRLYARLLEPDCPGAINAQAAPLLARFGLEPHSRLKLRKFSKGMIQKIALIQSLIHDPDILLLDEPSANLDPAGRRLVREIIEEMKRRGKTVVISSHILSEIEAVCDRVAILDRGELRGQFPVADLLRHREGWVVDCAPLSAEHLETLRSRGLQVDDGAHWHRIHVPEPELWNVLDWLRSRQAELLGVNPVHYTLEEAYLRLTAQGGAKAT
jgi:ABC-2 type transport system ATP-binding protein